jgi:hypothetical protein
MRERFGPRFVNALWPCQKKEQLRLCSELSKTLLEDADGVSRYALAEDGRRIVPCFDGATDSGERIVPLMIGDVLCFNLKRSPFTHQAVFVGGGCVAHLHYSNRVDIAVRLARENGYSLPSPMNAHALLACFCIQRLEDTIPKTAKWRLGHCSRAAGLTRQDVALRALQSLGGYVYNKANANCQDAISVIHGNTGAPVMHQRARAVGVLLLGLVVLLGCVFGLYNSAQGRGDDRVKPVSGNVVDHVVKTRARHHSR